MASSDHLLQEKEIYLTVQGVGVLTSKESLTRVNSEDYAITDDNFLFSPNKNIASPRFECRFLQLLHPANALPLTFSSMSYSKGEYRVE